MKSELPSNPLLEMRGITRDFPGVRAIDNVSFDLYPGEIHALVGENGAGKSTLVKILAGFYPCDSYKGDIYINNMPVSFYTITDSERAGIAVIYQELALVPHMSVAENIFLGDEPCHCSFIDWHILYRHSQNLMDQFRLQIDARSEVATLGVGEQQLVEIAKALRRKSKILILDEPTSALAEHEIELLFRIMRDLKAKGTSMIYISHKLDEVFRIADRITVFRDGKSVGTAAREDCSRQSVIKLMVGRELQDMFPVTFQEPGETLFEVENLTVIDPEAEEKMILEDISFSLRKGEILGISGLMGSGRTELLSSLFGNPPGLAAGRIRVKGKDVRINSPQDAIRAGLALIPEDRKNQGLILILSVLENLSLAHLEEFSQAGLLNEDIQFSRCRKIFGDLGIRASSLYADVETVSGGNQQKIVLGKWLVKRPEVFLMDEPTRGIDVGAKREMFRLMNGLKKKGVGIIMASSELPEVLGVCDRILVLRRGKISGRFSREDATQEKIMEVAA